MSRRCYIHPDCKSPIYGLPKDDGIREQWLNFIFNSIHEHYNPNIFLCSAHFTEDSFVNLEEYNAGFTQMLILKNESVPTLTGQPEDNGPNPDVDCCESSLYVNDESSSESLDSVSINQDQTLLDKHLSEETSGPTQESELSLTLLCYSEPDSDEEDESTEKITGGESHDIVCYAEKEQQILQTTLKACSVRLVDCRNLMEIKTEIIEEEHNTDQNDDEEDKHKRYDDFVPSDEACDDNDDHCIPSVYIKERQPMREKSGAGAKQKTTCKYFFIISFLEPDVTERATSSNMSPFLKERFSSPHDLQVTLSPLAAQSLPPGTPTETFTYILSDVSPSSPSTPAVLATESYETLSLSDPPNVTGEALFTSAPNIPAVPSTPQPMPASQEDEFDNQLMNVHNQYADVEELFLLSLAPRLRNLTRERKSEVKLSS